MNNAFLDIVKKCIIGQYLPRIVVLLDAMAMFVETLKLLALGGNTPDGTGLGLMNNVIEMLRV